MQNVVISSKSEKFFGFFHEVGYVDCTSQVFNQCWIFIQNNCQHCKILYQYIGKVSKLHENPILIIIKLTFLIRWFDWNASFEFKKTRIFICLMTKTHKMFCEIIIAAQLLKEFLCSIQKHCASFSLWKLCDHSALYLSFICTAFVYFWDHL